MKYDDSMNLRNILWLAPLPSNSSKAWVAPGTFPNLTKAAFFFMSALDQQSVFPVLDRQLFSLINRKTLICIVSFIMLQFFQLIKVTPTGGLSPKKPKPFL